MRGDARDGPDAAVDEVSRSLVVLDDRLDEQVERSGGDDDVVDLVDVVRVSSATFSTSPVTDTATIACLAKPGCIGSVTATICMTPDSTSFCTRWRTAASDSPTALPIVA